MSPFFIQQFSEQEENVYLKIRVFRDKIFFPLTVFFAQMKISPDVLSYGSLLMVLAFIVTFFVNPWISFVCLLIHLWLDALDGALARHLKVHNAKGALLDMSFDHLGFVLIMLTFLWHNLLSPFWAALYLASYLVCFFLTAILRSNNIQFFPIIRSRLIVYLFFLIWLVSGQNYFNPVLVFFSIYLVITDIFLFHKFRCSLL